MHSSRRIRTLTQTSLATAALTAGMIAAPRTFAQTSQIDNPDWPLRSSDIHWPPRYTPADADLFAHNELVMAESGTARKERLSQSPGEMKPKLLILNLQKTRYERLMTDETENE